MTTSSFSKRMNRLSSPWAPSIAWKISVKNRCILSKCSRDTIWAKTISSVLRTVTAARLQLASPRDHRPRGDRHSQLAEDRRDVEYQLARIQWRDIARDHDGAAGRQFIAAVIQP